MKKQLFTLLAIFFGTISVLAQVEFLDNSFGNDGKVVIPINDNKDNEAFAVEVLTNGKILVAGYTYKITNGADFLLVRLNSNGTLDNSWGNGGMIITDFGGYDYATSMKVQSDGKIVVGGRSNSGSAAWHFALARYNIDGSLDNTFSGDGKVITSTQNLNQEYIYSIAIQQDGKIIAAGRSHGDFAIARYNSDGSLDNDFGGDGFVLTDIGGGADEGRSVVVQPDGKIILGGFFRDVTDKYQFVIVRHNSNGTLDSSFGVGGVVKTDFGFNDDLGYSVAIQQDKKIILAGSAKQGSASKPYTDFGLVRYNYNGTLDNSFGDNGRAVIDFDNSNDFCSQLILRPNGKILAFGTTHNGSDFDFAVTQLKPNGSIDSLFGNYGKIQTDFGSDDIGTSAIIQLDDKIVVAGYTGFNGGGGGNPIFDLALARYIPSLSTQINDLFGEKNLVTIYPSNANQEITIYVSQLTNVRMQIFNIDGNIVKEDSIIDNTAAYHVNVSDWANGVYVIALYSRTTKPIIRKFIVTHE